MPQFQFLALSRRCGSYFNSIMLEGKVCGVHVRSQAVVRVLGHVHEFGFEFECAAQGEASSENGSTCM